MGMWNGLKIFGAAAVVALASLVGARAIAQPPQPAQVPPAAPEAAPADGKAKDDKPKERTLTGRPARVVVINFGPPSDWQNEAKDMVGAQVNAKSWAEALELLKKEDAEKPIDVVVVRINSGGGYTAEVEKFHAVFEQYMRKFRTVMWIESAISAAILSPWPIPEIYMMPQGRMGGATMWSGAGVASEGMPLQAVLLQAEKASLRAGRDPKIMRAMQMEDALSASRDANGLITYYQDESGPIKIKPQGRVLTINANQAIELGMAKGKAANLDELMKLMGYSEWELAGQRASKVVDDSMREVTRAENNMDATYVKYNVCVQGAAQLPRERRGSEIGRARQFLKQMRDWKTKCEYIGPPWEWFQREEKRLKDLLR